MTIISKTKNNNKQYQNICPGCYSDKISIFYEINDVPVNSVLLLVTQEEAINFPRGDIILGFCNSCSFIFNLAYDPKLLEYSSRYESTQGFSSTFNAFHQDLARRLIEQYDLHDKDIIEIGCGQGEFLTLLCDMGNNRGLGFDPVYSEERNESVPKESIKFVQDFFSEKYNHVHGDFVCCKMTLEHIPDTAEFIKMISQTLREKKETIVFFQVPNTEKIWRELAFWDVYYEHCSYFNTEALFHLFQENGFEVIDLEEEYDGQYLMITAKPGYKLDAISDNGNDFTALKQDIAYFVEHHQQKVDTWKNQIESISRIGKQAVIWGASSKGVAFLTSLKIFNHIQYAVDINPYKQNTYIAGTGQKIVSPEFLREYKPDYVIIMNPIYNKEIEVMLDNLGVNAEVLNV